MKKGLFICLLSVLSFGAYSQCSLSVSISQSAPSICSGYSVTLTATASGGSGSASYSWNTGQTTPSISVDKAGNYLVIATSGGCSATQSITVTQTVTPSAPTVTGNGSVCVGSSATFTATGPGGTYQWYTASTGGTFLASGATYNTPPINANQFFYVETTVNGCTSTRTAVEATLPAKPSASNVTTCSGDVATLTATDGSGYTWWDASTGGDQLGTGSTFTTPPLTQSTVYYVSSVSANGCTSARTAAEVIITPQPSAPTAASVSVCSGSSANLLASGSAGTYNWYNVASGGTPLISSPEYTTPALTQNTTYYVSKVNNGCEGPRTPVTVTVNAVPTAPASQADTICYQSSATLTATGSGATSYNWYNAPGGTLLATGATYTTPILTYSTTYYVQATNGSCSSALSPINVVVQQQLQAPTASGDIICYGSTATLTANAPGGGTFQWYDSQTGGNLLGAGQTYTTAQLTANTTFYVENIQNGCIGARTAVAVTVLTQVTSPTAPGTTICSGNSAELAATGSSGSYAWYDSATGGNLLSTDQVYVTPALTNTTTYYVQANDNNCSSTRTAVTVTVNPTPTITTQNVTICPGTAATLTATASAGTITWYGSASGGTVLATGPTYTTPILYGATTYYVESTSGTCSTGLTPVTVSLYPQYYPQFQYPYGSYCASSANPTPTINNPNGGTFSATPSGLAFVSTTTGEINIAGSTPGTYTVSFAGNGNCAGVETTTITIGATYNTTFSYNSPFCQNGANPLASTSGDYTASPVGLVFVSTVTGEIDLNASQPGTYTITNNVPPAVACPGTPSTFQVTIYQAAAVSAGPNQTVAPGATVQLAGSISGGATTGTWSGGNGTFANPNSPATTYTPGPGETSVTLKLTSGSPPAPCGPVSSSVIITFASQPAAPTAQGQAVCSGSGAILSATAPGGTYQWYDAATGGNLLSTGPNYTTPALTVTTTYYVQTTINGLTSSRTAVTATVNAMPAAPVCPSQQVCSGSSVTLTASGSTGTYQWYDAPSGGNLLSTGSTYTTPVISGNIAFYVQTNVNGCISSRTQVNITVTAAPFITSAPNGSVCSGQPHSYTITSNQPTATFSWSRPAVAGLSNPAVSNQTTSVISDTLVNTTNAIITVVYQITPIAGQCMGQPFSYAVQVDPVPAVTSVAADTVCSGTDNNYTVTFNTPVSNFTWSRPAVAGISNQPVSGQASTTIQEALFNTTTSTISVPYTFTYGTETCQGFSFNFTVTVNPQATVISPKVSYACYNEPQSYAITSNVPGATFSWSRQAVAGVSNPTVSNQTGDTITEILADTIKSNVDVTYIITPIANGCPGTPFQHIVEVFPQLANPVVSSNSPICIGDTIKLTAAPVAGATYLWTGPDNFSSTEQNPQIPNSSAANAGQYTFVYSTKECSSVPAVITFAVDQPPHADAGPNQNVCSVTNAVQLSGVISGGTTTGIWSTAGTGTFSPSPNDLTAQYKPSAADTAAGSVTLTLTSTSEDNCQVATSTMTIKFTKLPAAVAGPNQLVCNQTTGVQLSGQVSIAGGGTWSSSGTGTFTPSAGDLNATYAPSAADVASGQVELRLTVNDPGVCYAPVDSLTVFFIPPAAVFAGGTIYILKGNTATLSPTVSESNVHYLWTPDKYINNDTLKNPTITAEVNTVYTLTVTDSRGCISSDTLLVKVSPLIQIPNTFTPNGDGVNDYWDITGLVAYVNAVVDIYDRYGQLVFHSIGYPRPWDGTYGGKQVPAGTYYYVIHTNFQGQVLSGWVAVLR